jgi:RNA polymerase sigma factor (sigma-70 family)
VAQARIAAAAVAAELERLPERQRMALWLSAVEGQSYAEIAVALNTTDKSVKSLVHRARSGLAGKLPFRASNEKIRATEKLEGLGGKP